MTRSSINNSIILITKYSMIIISENMIKTELNDSVRTVSLPLGRRTAMTERRRSCERSAGDCVADDDLPQRLTWRKDESWWRSISSRVRRFPLILFALSRCKITRAKGSGDQLSRSPVHAGVRDETDYEGGVAARRGKTLARVDMFSGATYGLDI